MQRIEGERCNRAAGSRARHAGGRRGGQSVRRASAEHAAACPACPAGTACPAAQHVQQAQRAQQAAARPHLAEVAKVVLPHKVGRRLPHALHIQRLALPLPLCRLPLLLLQLLRLLAAAAGRRCCAICCLLLRRLLGGVANQVAILSVLCREPAAQRQERGGQRRRCERACGGCRAGSRRDVRHALEQRQRALAEGGRSLVRARACLAEKPWGTSAQPRIRMSQGSTLFSRAG